MRGEGGGRGKERRARKAEGGMAKDRKIKF